MKRLFLFLPLVTAAFPLFAANETSAGDVKRWMVFITLFVVVLAIVAHTIYLLATTKKLKENYTVETFRKNRAAAGLGAMTKEEVEELNTKLDSIDTIWGEIADSKGNMVVYPHSLKSLNQSLEILNAAIAANPDNKGIITKINDYNEVLNHALTRQFSGSKTIIAIAIILGLILGFGTGFYMAIVATIVTVLAYILASYTPNFMLIAQIARNGKRSTSLVKRLLLALIGSVTLANQNDKDKSERWVSYLLLFVGTIVMAFLLPIIALVNYLRNYVIYR